MTALDIALIRQGLPEQDLEARRALNRVEKTWHELVAALETVERWLVKDMQARGFERSPILDEHVRPALARARGGETP